MLISICHPEPPEVLGQVVEGFEKQLQFFIASESPAIRFIPMKNRDAHYYQV